MTSEALQGADRTKASRLAGIGLVLLSSLFFGLTGIFTRLIAADAWTIAGWRGLVGGMLVAAYVLLRNRARGDGTRRIRLGWRGWLIVFVSAAAGTLYIASFKHTLVANVAIIYAAIPFAAALFDRLISGERFGRATMANAALSMAGVAVMVLGSAGAGHLLGDALAFLMMLGSALFLALVRAFRTVDAVWATGVSALLLFPVALVAADPLTISARDLALTALFGLNLAVAMITWTEGAKRIPAAEAGLLGSAEIPVAIGFAWLLLAEAPPLASLAGGAVVLAAVLSQALRDLLASRRSGAV